MVGLIILASIGAILVLVTLSALTSAFYTVEQQSRAVVTRFGKFARIEGPGLHTKTPFIEQADRKVDMRIQQVQVTVETKTKDNVFVRIVLSILYYVREDGVQSAVYKLNDPVKQIESYVFDAVRSEVPKMDLNDAFESKDQIAQRAKGELNDQMEEYGYGIQNALVTDILVPDDVQDAMNNVTVANRRREAATAQGEAERILLVARAQAEKESKKLQGEGIADQRKAIVEGLKQSVQDFAEATGVNASEVMALVMTTQHYDTQIAVAAASKANTIFMDNGPDASHRDQQKLAALLHVPPANSTSSQHDHESSTPSTAEEDAA